MVVNIPCSNTIGTEHTVSRPSEAMVKSAYMYERNNFERGLRQRTDEQTNKRTNRKFSNLAIHFRFYSFRGKLNLCPMLQEEGFM